MSKIDEVMKAWQEDRKEVSWSDLLVIKAERIVVEQELEALKRAISKAEPVAWSYVVRDKIELETRQLDHYHVVNGEYVKGSPLYTLKGIK